MARPILDRDRKAPEASTLDSSPAKVIIASARRIDLADRKATVKALGKRQSWQADAWLVFHAIGEVKYANRFLANACGRLRLFAAVRPEPEQPPIPVSESTLPDNVKAAAEDALRRLQSEIGGQSAIMRMVALNMETAGECYLLGYEEVAEVNDEDGVVVTPARPERWEVRSTSEIEVTGDGVVKVKDSPNGPAEPVAEGTFFLRIWEPDPQWQNQPDSALRGVLAECDELLILSRSIRAAGRSRMPAGLLLVPSELSFGPTDKTDATDDTDPFATALVTAMTEAVEDEASPSALVPPVVRGKSEHLAELRHVLLSRPIDAVQADQRKELLRRLAQGLNVPPEVVLGMADVNHWTAWQVDASTFSAHVEPRALGIVDALTTGAFRPMFGKYAGVTAEQVEQVFIWYDESELVTTPNRGEDAKAAHDRLAISDDALRGALGFTDADAPDPVELERRIEAKRPPSRPGSPAGAGEDTAVEEGPPPAGDTPPPAEEPAAIAAAAPRVNPGARLARIDTDLFARLRVAADTALTRTLEKAGARLRSKASRDPATRAAVAGVDNADVAATLGPAVVRTLSTEDELLDGAFDGLHARYESWVAAAQRQALDLAERTWAVTPDRRAQVEREQLADRDEAWAWLHGALLTLARARLYDRDGLTAASRTTAALIGETDPSLTMPAGTIREALARAGGGRGLEVTATPGGGVHVRTQAGTIPAGGIGTGGAILDLAADAGETVLWFTWLHGAPAVPFPPHAELDGMRWYGDDDPNISASEGWLGAVYEPGDHAGCTCFAEPFIGAPSGGDLIG